MDFKICYTKLGNQFFFVSNLAEWHFSCRKKYNEKWIKQTGLLNKREKKALKDFKAIIKKYGFGIKNGKKIYLGIPFITPSSSQIWEKVKNWTGESRQEELKKIFEIFEPRFEKIWAVSVDQLGKTKQILEETLGNKKTDEILKTFSNLYGNNGEINKKILKIYLFSIPSEDSIGGGANLGLGKITIESSGIKKENLFRVLPIIFHEIAHLFEKRCFRPLLKKWVNSLNEDEKKQVKKAKIYQEIKSLETILNETIVSSLLPEGYLSEKFFGIKIKDRIEKYFKNNFKSDVSSLTAEYRNLKNLRSYGAYHLYNLAKVYVEQRKMLDSDYIREVYKIFKEFEKIRSGF